MHSYADTEQLICTAPKIVFAYAKIEFAHDVAQIVFHILQIESNFAVSFAYNNIGYSIFMKLPAIQMQQNLACLSVLKSFAQCHYQINKSGIGM